MPITKVPRKCVVIVLRIPLDPELLGHKGLSPDQLTAYFKKFHFEDVQELE